MEKKQPYFSRKNLIAISLAGVFSLFLLFVAMCIDAKSGFVSAKNPIALLAKGLNFELIDANATSFISVVLLAVYVIVYAVMFIFINNLAKRNNVKKTSYKVVLSQIALVIVCLALSLGLGVVIQLPTDTESIVNTLLYVGQSLAIALILYAAVVILVGVILMFIINFKNVDKPFRFFSQESIDEIGDVEEEDKDIDVTSSFDPIAEANANVQAFADGQGSGDGSTRIEQEELGEREKVFPALSTLDLKYDGFVNETIETSDVTLEELCVKFRNFLASKEKLYFDLNTIRLFISGLATSHFMILEGLSGTGKSSLPRSFAKFINGKVLFVPVQATWRDKTNLLGYFNDFSKSYTETEFLSGLYEANYNPDQINLFVLDEMNISRIEYYFADFLSTLEQPVEDWKLKVMQLPFGFIPPVQLEDGFVRVKDNSFFIGTANKDDSTFSITDKVYDRAITIDFENRNEPFVPSEEQDSICLSVSKFKSLISEAQENSDLALTEEDLAKFTKVTNYIYEEFDLTFGNRILNQMERLVPTFLACGGKKEDVLDFLLTRKVICKLEGRFEEYVKPALMNLLKLLDATYGKGVFAGSEKAINSLIKKL